MKHILLGAGFSRNWGGWLASEAFDYLIGCETVDADIKELLWQHKDKNGFEGALEELQNNFRQNPDVETVKRLKRLQEAITQMFDAMDRAFAETDFEFQNDIAYLVRTFLVQFDAIFSLNQDLLLERHYLDGNVELSSVRRWNGWQIPGMKRIPGSAASPLEKHTGKWTPMSPDDWIISSNLQPYIKLHGSSNWINRDGGQLLVMGGNKTEIIQQRDILVWYFSRFVEYLSNDEARLMAIGYGFHDDHINAAIFEAASRNGLKLFVIDPTGVDVTDNVSEAVIRASAAREGFIVGASTRNLTETFGNDVAEHTKLMRFFSH